MMPFRQDGDFDIEIDGSQDVVITKGQPRQSGRDERDQASRRGSNRNSRSRQRSRDGFRRHSPRRSNSRHRSRSRSRSRSISPRRSQSPRYRTDRRRSPSRTHSLRPMGMIQPREYHRDDVQSMTGMKNFGKTEIPEEIVQLSKDKKRIEELERLSNHVVYVLYVFINCLRMFVFLMSVISMCKARSLC